MSLQTLHRLRSEVGHHSLFFVVTNRCDTICQYCSCMPVLKNGWTELPVHVVTELLAWFAERREGFQTVQISGGEPLLHPEIFDIIRSAKTLGYITRLQTNGLVAHQLSPSDYAVLKDVRVKVSIDGPTAAVHEQFRRRGSFAVVVRGIEALLDAGITTGAKTVFTVHNLPHGAALVRFLSEMGVHAFTYNAVESVGYATSLQNVCVSEYQITREIIDTLRLRSNRHLLNGTNILRWHLASSPVFLDRLPWFIDQKGDVFRGQIFANMRKVGNVLRDSWDRLFVGRNPGYDKLTCDRRTFELIQRKLGQKNLSVNIAQ